MRCSAFVSCAHYESADALVSKTSTNLQQMARGPCIRNAPVSVNLSATAIPARSTVIGNSNVLSLPLTETRFAAEIRFACSADETQPILVNSQKITACQNTNYW